jgi:hypothetical protein
MWVLALLEYCSWVTTVVLTLCSMFYVSRQSFKRLVEWCVRVRPGTHYPHVTWAHVMLRVQFGCERRFNTKLYGGDSHFCHSAYVKWSHVPARLSHFCCCTHFVRRDVRVESRHCDQLFPEMEEMLTEKVRRRTLLYDTKPPDYREQHMRANAWEETGKVSSSRDVRIVCARLKLRASVYFIVTPTITPKVSLLWRSGGVCVVTWSQELCWR